MLDAIGYPLFLPAVPLLFLALLLRHNRYIYIAMVPVLVFLVFFYPSLKPQIVHAYEKPVLRIATYNILNSNRDVRSILSVIQQADSDVLAIQELTEDVKPNVLERLVESYPYYSVGTQVRGGTTAIFSKLPLTKVAEIDFGIDRPAVVATASFKGREITVASAHLNPIYYALHNRPVSDMPRAIQQYIWDQNKQAKLLIDVLQDYESDAFVLGCDCNSRETTSTNKILEHFFTDAAKVIGWGLGSTPVANSIHEHDLNRIDYLWYAGVLKTKGVYRIIDSGGSDHQLVFSDFNWQK